MRVKTALSLILLVSLIVVTRAGESDAEPVTQMGRTLLPRTYAIVRGEPEHAARIGAGAVLVGFQVFEVLKGPLSPGRILVLTSDPDYFPMSDPPCVLFLARLGSTRYEPLARVEITDRDGGARLDALRAYLEIEGLPSLTEKVRALHAFLLQNLFSNEHFLVWSAARELAPFSAEHPSAFSVEEFEAIRRASSETKQATLKELLETTVANLGHLRPEGEDDAPGGSGPSRVVDTLPPPPEFRALGKAFATPGLKADEREMILNTVAARHLKHGLPIFLEALSDEVPAIRVIAARNLGETLSPAAEKPLLELVATEKNTLVLEAAVQSLGVLGSESALAVIPRLLGLPGLLRACAFAAARIKGPGGDEILTGIRARHTGDDPSDSKIRELVDFLRSDTFRRQEDALDKVRRQRIR